MGYFLVIYNKMGKILTQHYWVKNKKTGEKFKITTEERKFWNFYSHGDNITDAYLKAYPTKSRVRAANAGSLKLKTPKFLALEENLWDSFKNEAPEAFKIQKAILHKKTTEPELKNRIANSVMDRAGYSPIIKNAQLRLNVNVDNPLSLKSTDELVKIFQETTKSIKKLEKNNEQGTEENLQQKILCNDK